MFKKKPTASEVDGVQYRRAKLWQIICYACNGLVGMSVYSLIGMASYSASIGYGITTAAVGIILTCSRILDGITDPLLAFVYDRVNTKFGKLRILMVAGFLIEALALYGMFTGFSSKGLGLPVFALLYIVYIIGYTITNMTAQTIPAIMTNDPRQRPTIGVWTTAFNYLVPMAMSMIFNVVLLPKCGGTYNQAFLSAACNMTLLAAGIGTALVCLGVSAYDKPETFVGTKKSEPLKMSDIVEVLKHNKPLQCYIASNASDKLAQQVASQAIINTLFNGILIGNMGLATIDPQKGFILNGHPYPLRGVSRHQDRKGAGVAITKEMMEEDMALILEMGANTIRLAHYQHAQAFYDLCDEKGLVIWAEIPYITMHMHNGRANTLTQMEELIVQNYNHPCIAVWGLSNEITAASAVNEELLENHRALNDLAHKLDPTRPTTMANVFMLEITSPILEIPDVNSYNLYFGWYLGELDQNDDFFDTYHAKYPDRCIGFSEYGADANPAYQSAHPEKGDYTETYQCVYHEHMAKMIADRPWLWATHVWNMFDFAADGRDEGGKNGENQKGLVTFDRKIKKDAFYLYKAYWSKQPFVHTCGSRYVDRTEDVTEVRVYSNLPEVSLYKDGHLVETKKGDKVFVFNVPITGKHSIEARAGAYSSVILVNKATEPNPAYAMSNRQVVNNWFDGELDETCWSVKDNMAAAMADAKVGPVLKAITDKAAAARGDVAAAVKDNPALVAMMERAMQRMTVEGMLKQAGADAESIKQLNRVLQGIKKDV